jgi:hypothetical protein
MMFRTITIRDIGHMPAAAYLTYRIPRAMLALVLVASAATAIAADSTSDAEAIHLVQAIGADRAALLGMQLSMERGVSEGKSSASQLACLERVDSAVFDTAFVATIKARFTHAEIVAAIAFLESALGVKYIRYGVVQMYRTSGAAASEPAPAFSPSELRILEGFLNGPLGMKLVGPQGVFSTTESTPILTPTLRAVYGSCRDA